MNTQYSAGSHASLFAYIAREVMNKDPNGEAVLRQAVIQYGHERGGRMRQRALKDKLPLNISTYLLYREYPVDQSEFGGPETHEPNGDFHSTPTLCPWSTKWKQLGLTQYCGVYCRNVDHALAEGFDPDCVIDSMGNLTDGDPHCDLYFRGVNISQPEVMEKMRTWGGRIKSSNAIKDWDYQLAHTYVSFRESLKKHYPEAEVNKMMERAVHAFEEEYGCGASEAFMDLIGLDFSSTDEYTGA